MVEQNVKVRVMKANVPAETSRQLYDDPFRELYGSDIIRPPYNIRELKLISERSTILQQCVEAYKTNIVEFGFEPEHKLDINSDSIGESERAAAEQEYQQVNDFLSCLNFDESAETIFGYAVEDREKTGNGYVEVLRDGSGLPAGIEYLDTRHTRVCTYTVPEQIKVTLLNNGIPKPFTRWKKFRRYCQIVNGKKVYFKEYGDPRIMDLRTGTFDDNTPENLRATEVIHFKIGSGIYGKPRWVGHIVSLCGARKAEELNFMYFKQGRHVPAAITVTNGMLSDDSYAKLQEYMNGIGGVENAYKFLLLEAEGIPQDQITNGDKKVPSVSVDIKPLAEILQKDALFLEYDDKTRNKLRSAFRLPPLYTGESQDYNKATADTARKITEEQVFQPERKSFARKLSTCFLNDLGINRVRISLKGPDFRDPLEISKALTPFIQANAAAPNDLRDLLGRVLGKKLEPFPDEFNMPLQMISQASALPIQKADQEQKIISLLKDLRDVIEESGGLHAKH